MQEYYTSGFLSLQAAIDAYVLDISSSLETSLPTGVENVGLPGSSAAVQRQRYWTQWGVVFPTAEYIHNEFYDGVSSTCSFSFRGSAGVCRFEVQLVTRHPIVTQCSHVS